MINKKLLLGLLLTLSISFSFGQDSNNVAPNASPLDPKAKKATLYALIPGGGQVYNKSYWKVPIVYAGFGVLAYSLMFYNREYNSVREAYIQKINGQVVTNPEFDNVPEYMLYNVRESYRKYRDLSAIGIVGWYAFTILDATVEAHLKEFDVGENLSLRIKPSYQMTSFGSNLGLKLQARF